MLQVAPAGHVYQAGTLSGNPLAMTAGHATLTALTPELHRIIERRTETLVTGLREIAARVDVPFTAESAGSMWGFFFHGGPVYDFESAKGSDVTMFTRFFHAALERGVYLAPSPFEASFMSACHGDGEVGEALNRLEDSMRSARE